MKTLIVLWMLCLTTWQPENTSNLTVKIDNIRNNKGVLQLAIFENAQQFEDESPARKVNINKSDIKNGKTSIKLKLKPGTYGITVLDDEDKSGDMSFKLRVYPKEGVGFSNYILSGLKKTVFSDFSFDLKNGVQTIEVVLKYF